MDCPICKTTGINAEARTCPECFSDLEAFRYLDFIETRLRRKRFTVILLSIILVIVVIALAYGWLWQHPAQKEKGPPVNDSALARLQSENQALRSSKDSLAIKLTEALSDVSKAGAVAGSAGAAQAGAAEKIITHTVKKGETLSGLARQYYGSGRECLRLARDNNLTDPDKIREGLELKIKNPSDTR